MKMQCIRDIAVQFFDNLNLFHSKFLRGYHLYFCANWLPRPFRSSQKEFILLVGQISFRYLRSRLTGRHSDLAVDKNTKGDN